MPRPSAPSRPGVRQHLRAHAERRRCAHLAGQGYDAAEIAAIEGLDEGHVEDLLGEEATARLARAYAVLSAKPEEEQRAKLVGLARFLIDEAIGLGHVRVAFFVVREELHGRDAAATVADKVLRERAKAAEPLSSSRPTASPDEPPTTCRAHLPAHPADRMAQRACRDLMRALLAEFRLRAEAALRSNAARRAAEAVATAVASIARATVPAASLWRALMTTAAITPGLAPRLAQAP